MKELQYSLNKLTKVEQEGIDAIVNSMIELIEPCLRQRIIQWMETLKTTIKNEDIL